MQGAQADLEHQLADCRAERDDAMAQLAATSEILQIINSSPGDLAPVFITILDKALHLCEAAFGFVTTYDGERFERAAHRGVPAALAAYFSKGMDQPRPGDAHWRLLSGEELIHNLDQMDEEAYRQGNPLRRAIVDLGGARSALVVALRKDDVTPEPAKRAVEMASVMRKMAAEVVTAWRRRGHTIGFGIGIAQGFATLGQIGFAERYTAIGTVTNVAARLCDEAKDGQILVAQRVAAAVDGIVRLEEIGNLSLKGLSQPIVVYNVLE